MINQKRKMNSGVSIVFVMAALIVTGLIGTALLKMGSSDQLASHFYSSSESARLAARSGVISATSTLGSSNPDTIAKMLTIINQYVSAANPDTLSDIFLWLKGGSNSWETLSSSQKYRVSIAAFHPETFEISLISEGVGTGGSRAEAMAVYDLSGLTRVVATNIAAIPTNALQMDNGAFEFDVPLIVNGNTSLRNGMHVWDPAHFRGTLRCDTLVHPDGTKEISDVQFSSGPLQVDSAAYFAGEVGGGGANAIFHSSVGFGGQFHFQNSNVAFDVTGNSRYVFAGGTNDAGCGDIFDLQGNSIEVYNNARLYKPADHMGAFTNYSNAWPAISDISVDIPTRVGLPSDPPPPIYFDTSALTTVHHYIDASPIYSKNKITATDLNNIYNTHKSNLLGGKFVVIRVTGNNTASGIFENDGSIFTGKAILWVDNSRNLVGDFVETSSDASLSVYIKHGTTTTPHFNDFNYARGYFYLNDYNTASNFAFGGTGGNCEIDGGVYAGPNTKLFFHGNGTQTVTFDPVVVSELAEIGIFNNPNDTSGSAATSATQIILDPAATRITPIILGQAM